MAELDIKAQNLEENMRNIFDGELVKNETVMFLDKGEARDMLFQIEKILSVTSYDGKTTYVEGVDYALKNGQIICLEGGSIPCITSDAFYHYQDSAITVMRDGKAVPLYWGEGTAMTKWQVNVTYTHSDVWNGYRQKCCKEALSPFIQKLVKGENVTVVFYGDSITFGANASSIVDTPPYQMPYTVLFTKALADLFCYNIRFIDTKLSNTAAVPADCDKGALPTITYINPSVGGWTSKDGIENYNTYVKPFIREYGCDLFLLGFGMNDIGLDPDKFLRNEKKICDQVIRQAPEVNLLLMATMVPNPDGIEWYKNQADQEKVLIEGAKQYNRKGTPCAVIEMGSASLSILDRKRFCDYTGNNINHPNDFFTRIYAQTLLQCVIGYENMK